MTTLGNHRHKHIFRALFILLAVMVVGPAMAQNTRGDRPVDNQRKIRENKSKTVKKKEKGSTRDIAGRRLRTKNKSSANRANVGIRQPSTTSRQPRRQTDRAARVPSTKRYSSREKRNSDPDRSWQGDISGYKPRKIKPSSAEETGRNVYKQRSYTTRQPSGDRPFKSTHTKTATGRVIVKRTPQRTERAWKGDIKGQPLAPPPSKTGRYSNVYPQRTRYSKYVSKAPSGKDRSFSNKASIAKARRMGTDTSPKRWRSNVVTATGQKPFVVRGRKNVYWGKMKRTERATTRDMAGKPLLKKNFRSSGIGLTGRDTLAFFGRKPHGDLAGQARKRRFMSGTESRGGWLGDIAGYRLRKSRAGGAEKPGTHQYSGFRSISGKYRHNQPVQGKAPGIGAGAVEKGLRKTKGGAGGNYQDQGGAFTGVLKGGRRGKFGGSKTGGLWNNGGTPIQGKLLPGGAGRAGTFSGHTRGKAEKDFADQGSGFTGYTKQGKRGRFIGSRSGKGWNNGGVAVQGKLLPGGAGRAGTFSGHTRGKAEKDFADQGSGFTGYVKQRKQGKFIGSYNRAFWNNNGTAVQGRLLPGGATRAGRFSGHIRGKAEKDFADQGSGFTGYIKQRKPHEFSGSKSGGMWNNKGRSTTELETTKAGAMAGNFQGRKKTRGPEKGRLMATPDKLWNNRGKPVTELETTKAGALAGNFQGRKKTRGPEKGKMMLTPNKLWNNNEKPVTELETTKAGALAGNFQGRKKTRQPDKGKIMHSPNVLWNNREKPVTELEVTKSGALAGTFQGRNKAKEQQKYPLNSSNKSWNNNGQATTRLIATKSGAKAGVYQGTVRYRKADKESDSDIQQRLKMKREYTQNPHSVEEATKKQKPELNYKAGNYSSGVKVVGKRRHHPHSSDDAIDGVFATKANARAVDYQGNVKMRKFHDRRESPDARFVHIGENNVKEERTIVTNVKLFWSKLFQKSDSQPANLKERSNKLRYDKGEKGMWND